MKFAKLSKADEFDSDRELMCRANECPNRWAVNCNGNLCSAHAWADPKDWASITDQELRKFANQQSPRPALPTKTLTMREKQETIKQIAALLKSPTDLKAWAIRLRDKEAAGERLSSIQSKMWRGALREK
jgi:hypothetical protein